VTFYGRKDPSLTDIQAVEFPAHEYSRYNEANNEQQYEYVMGLGVVKRIKNTEHNQANGPNHGEDYREGADDLLYRVGQSAELANIALLLTPIGQYWAH
jgi:hypothetical protein